MKVVIGMIIRSHDLPRVGAFNPIRQTMAAIREIGPSSPAK